VGYGGRGTRSAGELQRDQRFERLPRRPSGPSTHRSDAGDGFVMHASSDLIARSAARLSSPKRVMMPGFMSALVPQGMSTAATITSAGSIFTQCSVRRFGARL
jgi:hypothetical protein